LTTEECLLSDVQQRNPGFTRDDYERVFADYLGIEKVLWLGNGIVTMVERNPADPNHAPLDENLRRLRAATDQNGKKFQIVEVVLPRPVTFEGRRLPASYANFYIANGLVLVPVFNDPNDRLALNTFADLFPTRDIIPIYSGDFVWGLGTMHCMTQQQPVS